MDCGGAIFPLVLWLLDAYLLLTCVRCVLDSVLRRSFAVLFIPINDCVVLWDICFLSSLCDLVHKLFPISSPCQVPLRSSVTFRVLLANASCAFDSLSLFDFDLTNFAEVAGLSSGSTAAVVGGGGAGCI